MKKIIFLIALFAASCGCKKANIQPQTPHVRPLTIYSVKVVLKWPNYDPTWLVPTLYDSANGLITVGSPVSYTPDTVLNISDWFSTYTKDTVQFCLAENAHGWQTAYSNPIFGLCEEQFFVNGVKKIDTTLRDFQNITSPTVKFIVH